MSIVRVTMFCNSYGQVCNITPHFDNIDGLLTMAQIATELQGAWLTAIRTVQFNSAFWYKFEINDVNSPTTPTFVSNFANLNGTGGLNNAHPQVCYLWSMKTALRGRKGRGRMYIPGINSQITTASGTVGATLLTTNNTAITNIMNRYGPTGTFAGSLKWVLWSRADNVARPITECTIRNNFGTQRRRNIGVGV